jgi:phospholipid/cholesterol/gamma-HCH transport system substrate-binding protein
VSSISTTFARLRNTPNLGRDMLVILVVSLLGLGAMIYLFSHEHVHVPFVSRQYHFSAEFDKAPGLQLASRQEVRIAGVTVGKITGASVAQDGNARLSFAISGGHPVYKDARLVMESKSPVNLMYVTLDPGTPSAGELPSHGTIPVSQTRRITQSYELLDNLDDRARAALTDLVDEADVALAGAPTALPPALKSTNAAAKSFQPVVDALAARRENLKHLVTSVSQIATAAGGDHQRLARLAADLETTLSVVGQRDRELGSALDELPGVTSTLRTSMDSVSRLSKQLSPTLTSLSQASGKLPKTLDSLATTVQSARGLIDQAGPVVSKARPVVENLAPLTSDLHSSLGDLAPVTSNLPGATAKLVPWLDNLGAFIYNTSSSFSLGDANGGVGRLDAVVKVLNPTGGGL